MNNISLVIEREYRERVAKKSFIITTILMPLFMLVMMVAPALIMTWGGSSTSQVMVIDQSKAVAENLHNTDNVLFVPSLGISVDSAVNRADIDAVAVIPSGIMDAEKTTIKFYSNGPSSMMLEGEVRDQVSDIVEKARLRAHNIENLDKILEEVKPNIVLQTIRSDRDSEEAASSEFSYILGIMLTLVLYMFLLLYGQMVMTSIIEEKNNRVLEVVVSSVKPMQMMLGKIIGVALVAVTQIVIWGVLMGVMSAFVLPALLPADLSAQIAAASAGNMSQLGSAEDVMMLKALGQLTNVGYILGIMGVLTLFLVGGFLFYAAMYAAIGSSVDNIQDAGQLQMFTMVPIVLGLLVSMSVATDPSTPLAFWLSMIPFTSPMVMMARVPFGIPAWEIVVSLVVLYASFVAMVWIAGKIYRVGIFMYGKKPTPKELWRWVRYK